MDLYNQARSMVACFHIFFLRVSLPSSKFRSPIILTTQLQSRYSAVWTTKLPQLMPRLVYRLFKVCLADQLPPSDATTDIRCTIARRGTPRVTRRFGCRCRGHVCAIYRLIAFGRTELVLVFLKPRQGPGFLSLSRPDDQ